MIDFHVHMGTMYRELYPEKIPLTAHQLIDRMDREGVDIGVLLPLAAVGLLLQHRRVPAVVPLFIASYGASLVLVFPSARYRVPVVPALTILAAAGCLGVLEEVRRRRWGRLGIAGICAGGVVLLATLPGPFCEEEVDYEAEFESPALLTLGIVFEQERRFAGGAYHPFLRKVDRFSSSALARSLRERKGWASRLIAIDREVARIIDELRERGFRSPYLRNLVVARINPVRFHRAKKGVTKPPMAIGAALTRMAASAKRFSAASVRASDLALVAAVAGDEGD